MELAETCYGNNVLHTCLNQREKNTTLQASQCISWILVNNETYINFLKYLVYNARQRG